MKISFVPSLLEEKQHIIYPKSPAEDKGIMLGKSMLSNPVLKTKVSIESKKQMAFPSHSSHFLLRNKHVVLEANFPMSILLLASQEGRCFCTFQHQPHHHGNSTISAISSGLNSSISSLDSFGKEDLMKIEGVKKDPWTPKKMSNLFFIHLT